MKTVFLFLIKRVKFLYDKPPFIFYFCKSDRSCTDDKFSKVSISCMQHAYVALVTISPRPFLYSSDHNIAPGEMFSLIKCFSFIQCHPPP